MYQRGLNGAGLPIPGVLFDIEGKIRNDQAPDIGAWEFMVDFGITRLLSPTNECLHPANDSLSVMLRQYGDIPFTDIVVAGRINNGPVTYDTIVGTIYNDMVYTFPQPVSIANQGTYAFKYWLVNNHDDNINNDTLTVQRYSYPAPDVDFTWQGTGQHRLIEFQGFATIDPPFSIASYEWHSGDSDTATVLNPVHQYEKAGIYEVTFMAYNNMGCFSRITKPDIVEYQEIDLIKRWNIISFNLTPDVMNLQFLVQPLIGDSLLIKMQDETGNSLEDYGIFGGWTNNIGNFKPGKGYKVKVSANDTLTIEEAYLKSSSSPISQLSGVTPTHFKTEKAGNGVDHMNINLVNLPLDQLQEGDEIGVYDGHICVGSKVFSIR